MIDDYVQMPLPSLRSGGLWGSVVRLSAGMLVRDYRERAYDEALSCAELANNGDNILAQTFWNDVAEKLETSMPAMQQRQ